MAVQAFLDERISFRRIDYVVANVLDKVMTESAVTTIDSVLMHDRAARDGRNRFDFAMIFIQTFFAFIFALSVLIVFHELGHYWMARLCNVKVLRFSLGMGKILYSRKFRP